MQTWTFHQFILEGEQRGFDRREAVQRLLQVLPKPAARGHVFGLCRIERYVVPPIEDCQKQFRAERRASKIATWLENDSWARGDWRDHGTFCRWIKCRKVSDKRRSALQAARDRLQPIANPPEPWEVFRLDRSAVVVPQDVWEIFNTVESDLTSRWVDDPDEPEQFASVDWASGTFSDYTWFIDYDAEPWFERRRTEYASLSIAQSFGKKILSFSDEELLEMAPALLQDEMWKIVQESPRHRPGYPKQERVREIWNEVHKHPRPGRKPSAKQSGTHAIT